MENSYTIKRRQLESRASALEVIVTGSSGAQGGVDPGVFGVPAYNLANGSQTLHYDIEILSRYLDRLPRLRLVIIADPYSYLAVDLRNTRESWRQYFYSVFWDVPMEEPSRQLVTIQRHSYIALYSPMEAAKAAMAGFYPSLGNLSTSDGWGSPVATSAAEHAERMSSSWTRLRVEGHKDGMRPETQRRNVEALRKMAERLRARGIWLALVWIPVSRSYTEWFGEEALAKQRAAQEDLATRPNVRFFDYSSDARFEADDFADADHLGLSGARKFSDILATEVVSPILKLTAERLVGTTGGRP